jgi:hypothetical protein
MTRLRITLASIIATLAGFGLVAVAAPPAQAVSTHTLRIRFFDSTAVLTVPSSWHVSRTAPTPQCGCGGDYDPVCIVADGDYDRNPNNCELVVGGNTSTQVPDEPVPGYRLPTCDSWTTTYEARSRVGPYAGEYRVFLDRCHDRKSEQWTSLTTPSVSIWHPLHWNGDDTAAAAAARSLRIVAKRFDVGRTRDLGFVRKVVVRNRHAYVTIDRAVMSLSGHAINHNPATYVHRIRQIRGNGDCPHFLSDCGAAQLLAQFRKGAHPADGTRPLRNRLVLLTRYGGWSLDGAYRNPFTSGGDSGHCGC